jgi:AcrR family transcriptional regulator
MGKAKTEAAARGRRKADQPSGRAALLSAGLRAFGDMGYEGASIRAIAQSAGVTPNLVAVHFGDKAGLWTACVDWLAEEIAPALESARALGETAELPLRARLEAGLDLVAAFYAGNRDLRGFVARAATEPSERSQPVAEKLLKPIYRASLPLIEEGIRAGLLRASHPAFVFVILHAALGRPEQFSAVLSIVAPDLPEEDAGQMLSGALRQMLLKDG